MAAAGAGEGGPVRRTLGDLRDVLLDLDGCVWFGDRLDPCAPSLVRELRAAGRRVHFLTNASGAEPGPIAAKLTALGVPAAAADVVSPLLVVTRHPVFRGRTRACVVGKPAVARALADRGVEVVDDPEAAEVVVVGNDAAFDYADLTRGMRAVDAGAELLALNLDRRLPVADGRFVPGTGAIVAALEAATGRTAHLVGKPSTFFFEQALAHFGAAAEATAMVGDTVESDIAGGRRANLFTILIGSADALKSASPDLRFADLCGLRDAFRSAPDPAAPAPAGRGG